MKRFIIKKSQLQEFLNRKKEEKTFYSIVEDLHKNNKFLNENISRNKVNQAIIDNYQRKNLITPYVQELLVKHKIINEKREII
jgi:hypothetical protein